MIIKPKSILLADLVSSISDSRDFEYMQTINRLAGTKATNKM